MDNISGSAANWIASGEVREKEEVVNRPPLDLSHELAELKIVTNKLELKYRDYPNKHIYDAVISLYLAHNSLTN